MGTDARKCVQKEDSVCQRLRHQTQTVNNCCLSDCIDELNIWSPKTWLTAICTSVHVCHVLIHYLQCCTELITFAVQQLSLNVWCVFSLELQGYDCGKFHLNRFRNVWDILQNKRGCFSEDRAQSDIKDSNSNRNKMTVVKKNTRKPHKNVCIIEHVSLV